MRYLTLLSTVVILWFKGIRFSNEQLVVEIQLQVETRYKRTDQITKYAVQVMKQPLHATRVAAQAVCSFKS